MEPTAISAPCSPGGVIRVRASRSAATVTSAPRSLASAITPDWSHTRPETPGCWRTRPLMSPSGRPAERSATCTSKPSASARPLTMAMVCGRQSASRTVLAPAADLFLLARRMRSTASATAVASSRRDALATGSAVRSWTMVWKFSSASRRPWEISGWYGRVGGVPGGGFEDVAADHRRGDGVVVALADHLHGRLVLGGELAQFGQHLDFAEGAVQGEGLFLADGIGDRVVNEAINAVVADGLEHGVDVGLAAGADVAVCEGGRGRLNRHERNSIIQVASRRHDDSGSSPLCIGPESFRFALLLAARHLHRR